MSEWKCALGCPASEEDHYPDAIGEGLVRYSCPARDTFCPTCGDRLEFIWADTKSWWCLHCGKIIRKEQIR